jgi:gliding motility-associated-like protein
LSDVEGTYLWSDGTTEPTMSVEYYGTYWVEVLDDDYCFLKRDTVLVVEGHCECPIYIPNAFTPDDDGLNDHFNIVFECEPYDFTFEVFDRWGNTIFRSHWSHYPDEGWDGKIFRDLAPDGLYHWRVWYRESFHGIPTEEFGNLTLLGGPLED